jgi:3-methyladenine DNA glycosylase/8-oxoguanine DNA glycosylase
LPDDEIIAELTTVPGIGPWTVQGALLVALGREDVVPPGDLALCKAVQATVRTGGTHEGLVYQRPSRVRSVVVRFAQSTASAMRRG